MFQLQGGWLKELYIRLLLCFSTNSAAELSRLRSNSAPARQWGEGDGAPDAARGPCWRIWSQPHLRRPDGSVGSIEDWAIHSGINRINWYKLIISLLLCHTKIIIYLKKQINNRGFSPQLLLWLSLLNYYINLNITAAFTRILKLLLIKWLCIVLLVSCLPLWTKAIQSSVTIHLNLPSSSFLLNTIF